MVVGGGVVGVGVVVGGGVVVPSKVDLTSSFKNQLKQSVCFFNRHVTKV